MEELEDIYIQALAQRYNSDGDLLEKLPEDVRPLVEKNLASNRSEFPNSSN